MYVFRYLADLSTDHIFDPPLVYSIMRFMITRSSSFDLSSSSCSSFLPVGSTSSKFSQLYAPVYLPPILPSSPRSLSFFLFPSSLLAVAVTVSLVPALAIRTRYILVRGLSIARTRSGFFFYEKKAASSSARDLSPSLCILPVTVHTSTMYTYTHTHTQ